MTIPEGCMYAHIVINAQTQELKDIMQIMMYIYHALINALSAHMIHISLNMIYTHAEHSPTKTNTHTTCTPTHPQTNKLTVAETGYC